MYILYILLGLAFLLSFWAGFRRMVRLQHLTQRRVINGFIGAMIILTLMTLGQWLGWLPQEISAEFTMVLYALTAGFFSGFAVKMVVVKQRAKQTEYVYRSFWTEAAPAILAILIVAFGLYRTGLFTFGPYTGIGISSGISLVGFGFWGFTVKIVPEFRREGILILDQFVPWNKVVAYRWESENVLQIDYYTDDEKLTDFTTYIPPEDELVIERLLGRKLKEHEEDRKKMMDQSEELK